MPWWPPSGSLWRSTWATTSYPLGHLIWRRFTMTPPPKRPWYSSSLQVLTRYQFHSLHSFCTFNLNRSKFLFLVACYKNCVGFRHWSFGPAGQICRGVARQCLTPGHDLPGSRSRPQSRGVDLKGPDPEGPLGVSTELSSGGLLHAKAPGHCRKVSPRNQLPLVLSNEYIVFFLKKLRKRGRYSPHELLLLKNSISIFFEVHVILLVLHFYFEFFILLF